ncbi:hypothetical protein C3469_04360 [Mycobacterium kansasii]|uniref:DNA N-6-adenine-methyltransferase n=1 Tax=Mycobacterium kansasii TaxID=1768 RepID=UPI000CDD15ED|nr:DNA N-6-adenine-methyltransferase [Mycobacterium kansasii]POY04852.1 hypothetical protein C3479_00150 [Mycobacterium kansasii]POY29135.1 hypothetical protein C3469_04360 [Mycobacterium kansasii]POY34242.1 hypothetical protein C3478_02280 [Mycobacterium kansasii]
MSEAIASTDAKRLDQRIRLLAGSIGDSLAKLHQLVDEAKQGEIHKALGFSSWTAYLADALTIHVQLGREQRRELVGYLSGEGMSQRAIADVVGVDQKTVSNDLRSGEENSSPVLPPVIGIDGKRYPPRPHVSRNTGDGEWFTPLPYIKAAANVLGGIDLDPASSLSANEIVGASRYYTAEDNGLTQPWSGRVWLNPPYSQPLVARFCEKLASEYASGAVTAACALLNNATETRWFQELARSAAGICFPLGRIKFWHPDKTGAAPLQGQAIVYLGDNLPDFRREFAPFGLAVSQ